MRGDYDYLPAGWRELCLLLADIRDELQEINTRRDGWTAVAPTGDPETDARLRGRHKGQE